MHPIFAQIPEASSLLTFAVVIIFIGQVVTAWGVITNRASRTKIEQPLEVTEAAKFTSKQSFNKHLELERAEFDKMWTEISKLLAKIDHNHVAVIEAGQSREREIIAEVHKIGDKVGELRGQFAEFSRTRKA